MYNALPTAVEANARFVDRNIIFEKLAPLLAKFQYQFGAYLVHSHGKLEPGEKMIATGNVCQPEEAASFPGVYYTERWLSNGEPFEFTTAPTSVPPKELVYQFQEIVGDVGLGLYFSGTSPGGPWYERTEGRRVIVEQSGIIGPDTVETSWLPKMGPDGLLLNPTLFCISCREAGTSE